MSRALIARDNCGMIQGCSAIDASGNALGSVNRVYIEKKSRLMRYVMVDNIAIPWSCLFYDGRKLVFHTFKKAEK